MGKVIMVIGFVCGAIVFLVTVVALFARGEVGMAALALMVPPADLILAFLITPSLGVAGIASAAAMIAGFAIDEAEQRRGAGR